MADGLMPMDKDDIAALMQQARMEIDDPRGQPMLVEAMLTLIAQQAERIATLETCDEYLAIPVKRELEANYKAAYEDLHRICDAKDAELAAANAKIETLVNALVDHNNALRSAFMASQRDGIHDTRGTSNYNLMADSFHNVLARHHAVTNEARAALAALKGEGNAKPD